jgi:hypothetical protein
MGLYTDATSHLARGLFVPVPVQGLGRGAELDQEVAGHVLRLDLAARFSCHRRTSAAGSSSMMIRASEPPTNARLSGF